MIFHSEEEFNKARDEAMAKFSAEYQVTDIGQTARLLFKEMAKRYRGRIIFSFLAWGVLLIFHLFLPDRSNMIQFLLVLPFIVMFFMYVVASGFAEVAFWQQFAKSRGWRYEPSGHPEREKGFMFDQGHSQQMHHLISGTDDGRPVRIFSYRFTVGSGKHSRTYSYAVFGFTFQGRFPHLYLNRRGDEFGSSIGEYISLPREFEKKFYLYGPKEYEVEALQVFTPEFLTYLLDSDLPYDIEIVDGELLIFKPYHVGSLKELEKELSRAKELVSHLSPRLDGFRFERVGDYSPALSLD